MLTNQEITILSYMADALKHRPRDYRQIIAETAGTTEGSKAFKDILKFMEDVFEVTAPADTEAVCRLASTLHTASVVLDWGQVK